MPEQNPLSLVVLISGRGSNLKAILDAIRRDQLPAVVTAVISDTVRAPGLEYARQENIDTLALDAAVKIGRASCRERVCELV